MMAIIALLDKVCEENKTLRDGDMFLNKESNFQFLYEDHFM